MLLFFSHYFYTNITINIFEILFLPFFFVFIYFTYRVFFYNKIETQPHYRYFWLGLFAKMASAIAFALIAMLVYEGDTLEYFHGIQVMNNLFYYNPISYFKILFNGPLPEYFTLFNTNTGWPAFYMWIDPNTFAVIRYLSPIGFFTFDSFIFTTIFVSIIAYSGIWKLYSLFAVKYPFIQRQLAIAILFMPSVLYWGSGILKDTMIMFALGWLLYAIHKLINNQIKLKYIFIVIICSYIIIIIKAYVFVVLLPSIAIWIFYERSKKIKNKVLRLISLPFFIVFSFVASIFSLGAMSEELGKFGSVDTMITKARVTQEDLIREEQYGENYFFIGNIGDSPAELLVVAPEAIIAGLFRPFLWDARNPFMLIAGLENFIVLLIFIWIFFRRRVLQIIKNITADPFLLGMFIFVIFFAFGVGLSSANFGALVRYRIPLLPIFVSSLLIVRKIVVDKYKYEQVKKNEINNTKV